MAVDLSNDTSDSTDAGTSSARSSVGISGWRYPPWRSTFYSLQRPSSFQRWARIAVERT